MRVISIFENFTASEKATWRTYTPKHAKTLSAYASHAALTSPRLNVCSKFITTSYEHLPVLPCSLFPPELPSYHSSSIAPYMCKEVEFGGVEVSGQSPHLGMYSAPTRHSSLAFYSKDGQFSLARLGNAT